MAEFFLFLVIMALTIGTINVRSIGSAWRRIAVFDELQNVDADVICVQETWLSHTPRMPEWEHGESVWSLANTSRNEGVGVLIKSKDVNLKSHEVVVPGRVLMCMLDCRGVDVRLFNVYGHADKNQRKELLECLKLYLPGRVPTVVVGDFNLIRFPQDREGSGESSPDVTSKMLNGIIEDFRLQDAAKVVGGGTPMFTYFADSGICRSRLDFALLSEGWRVELCDTLKVSFSDHVLLRCKAVVEEGQVFGRGVWKLNTSLLEAPGVLSDFKLFFEKMIRRKGDFDNVMLWWDFCKKKIAGFFKGVGIRKAQVRKAENAKLVEQLFFLYRCKRLGLQVEEEIVQVRERRNEELKRRGKELIFQAKLKDLEEGEKCSRFFFKKIFKTKGCLKSVLVQEGEVFGEEVCGAVKAFYQDLYGGGGKVRQGEAAEYCSVLEDGLSGEDKMMLREGISAMELLDRLKEMKSGKTPGKDGLPAEFYVKCWPVVGVYVTEVINYCVSQRCTAPSMKDGLITLIHKKGDQRDMKNWRPITLLNCDYKLLAKVFAKRLSEVVDKMVGEWQLCAVPGRRIAEGLTLLRDLTYYVQSNNVALTVAGMDLEKAFDKVNHAFLFHCLLRLGIPEEVVEVFKSFYDGIESQVLVNGKLSEPVLIRSGVRQGCPLSPIFFICVMEPLLRRIQADKMLKGFFLPGGDGLRLKSMCYMDDICVFCSTQADLNRLDLQLRIFSGVSGLKVNWGKSSICNLSGRDAIVSDKIPRVASIKILGVSFERDMLNDVNPKWACEKIQKKVDFWKLRSLTLTGKILIIKSVLLPLLLYYAVVFPFNVRWCKKIERVLAIFLWGSKMERVKREEIKKLGQNGGLGFPDVQGFINMHFWLSAFKIFAGGGRTARFMRYHAERVFVKFGWCGRDLLRPTALIIPSYYLKLKSFYDGAQLEGLGEEATVKSRLVRWLRRAELVSQIYNFPSSVSEVIWCRLGWKDVTNWQKEVVWLGLRGCLQTKLFLKARDLVREDTCPRRGCGGVESTYHVFWGCDFANELKNALTRFVKEVLGVGNLSFEFFLFGLVGGGRGKQRKVWIFNCIVKEVLWNARQLCVRKNVLLSTHECVGMVASKLHFIYLKDVQVLGEEEAEELWKRSRWDVLFYQPEG